MRDRRSGVRQRGVAGGVLAVAGLSAGVLFGGVAQAAPPQSPGSAGTGTLAPFTVSTVSSVAVNGDTNPYSVAVVPQLAAGVPTGKLTAGNVLVVDFNKGTTPGAGTTIVQVNPATGATSVFASGLPISGPVGIAINPVNDGVWVANFGATDGSTSNDLLILPDGTVKANYNTTSVNANPGYTGVKPTFDGLWGEGVSKHAGQVSFYYGTTGSGATGTGGGQVWRIDPHPAGTANGQPVNSTYAQIATGLGGNATTKALPVTAANAAGPQGFAYNDTTGVMYVSNQADNTITAITNAATATGPAPTTTVPVAAGVLNVPENIALNPVNGDLFVVNAGNNTLIEINPATGAVLGSRVLDTGAPGALFGLAVTTDAAGRPVIYYGNDNDNTLNVVRSNGFTPAPARLLDTRDGTGGGTPGQVQGLRTITLPASVPVGSTAALTVTATGSAGSGFVQVYPAGTTPSTTSNVNFDSGSTAPDAVLVTTPSDRKVSIVVGGSAVDLVVDLSGYVPATAVTAVSATRIGDSRNGTGFTQAKVSGTQTLTLPSTIPANAGLVALTVTATQADAVGNVVAYSGATVPATSNVNFTPGRTQANLVLVKPTNGTVSFKVNGGPTDLVVDVAGYTPAGSAFTAIDPSRIADSRMATGLKQGPLQGAVDVTMPATVPAGTTAVLLNVTATDATGPGFVAAYPAGKPQPATSNVNYDKGVTGANLVVVPVGANNAVTLFVGGAGANLVVDISGYVTN